MRKSVSFHSGDTKMYQMRMNLSPLSINPLWDNEPMCKMEISPNANSNATRFSDIETGKSISPKIIHRKHTIVVKIYNCSKRLIRKYYIECINVSLCVLLHVFIMIIFEIYFYFNYVVVIEKAAFIQKINEYFEQAEKYKYNTFISLDTVSYNRWLNVLYAEYMASRNAQAELLYELLQKACEMGGAFGVVLLVIGGFALYNRDRIRWKTILAENIGMLALLGFFEYLFFTRIIMNYNPISNAELEYLVAKKTYDIFAKNGTMHYL